MDYEDGDELEVTGHIHWIQGPNKADKEGWTEGFSDGKKYFRKFRHGGDDSYLLRFLIHTVDGEEIWASKFWGSEQACHEIPDIRVGKKVKVEGEWSVRESGGTTYENLQPLDIVLLGNHDRVNHEVEVNGDDLNFRDGYVKFVADNSKDDWNAGWVTVEEVDYSWEEARRSLRDSITQSDGLYLTGRPKVVGYYYGDPTAYYWDGDSETGISWTDFKVVKDELHDGDYEDVSRECSKIRDAIRNGEEVSTDHVDVELEYGSAEELIRSVALDPEADPEFYNKAGELTDRAVYSEDVVRFVADNGATEVVLPVDAQYGEEAFVSIDDYRQEIRLTDPEHLVLEAQMYGVGGGEK